MKISEMTNEQATEAMIRISVPISNLCDDKEFISLMDEMSAMDKETNVLVAIKQYLPKIVTFAFNKHKKDLYEIVGALTEQSAEKVGKMNFMETIRIVRENINELSDFFTHSGNAKPKTEEE